MRFCSWYIMLLFILLSSAVAQEKELALMEQVSDLQQQLDSDLIAKRDAAEKQLIELGIPILDYLEPASEQSTSDYAARVNRIRSRLEKAAVNSVTKASVLNLIGEMSLGEALKKIKRQTGNDIAVVDETLLEVRIQPDLNGVEFWPALQRILSQSKLRIDQYGSRQSGQMMLVPEEGSSSPDASPTTAARIFQVSITRVDSSINLDTSQRDFTMVNFRVRWEPRLRPISVDLPLRDVSVTDEFGDTLPLSNRNRVIYGLVQPQIPEVEFALQMPRIDRQVENIKTIKATIDAVLPGRVESFRFDKVSKLKAGQQQSRAGATVTFDGIRKNEDLYSVRIRLAFDEDNNALESHRGWVFENKVFLLNRQREREEAISLETLRQDNQEVVVQYYFLNDPGDRTLVYTTPATIVRVPVAVELKNIPLP